MVESLKQDYENGQKHMEEEARKEEEAKAAAEPPPPVITLDQILYTTLLACDVGTITRSKRRRSRRWIWTTTSTMRSSSRRCRSR